MADIKKGVIWFVVTLLAYILILFFFGGYEVPSYIYHALLLVFPLGLIFTDRENIRMLGLVKGNWKTGLSIAGGVIIVALVIFRFRYGNFILSNMNSCMFKLIIFAPITEELFLRGYFQPKLESSFGKWIGLVITAILFAVIHLPKILLTPLATLAELPLLFILGLVFGFVRDESGSVYYSMIGHGGYNMACSLVFGC